MADLVALKSYSVNSRQVKQMLEEKVQGLESHDTIFLDQFGIVY